MTGIPLVIAFVIAIILMIVAISKWKIHPFLSIMSVSLLLAIVAGIDLAQIADVIGAGFSGTFTSIGIVIILGAMVGTLLEKTGAALKMADCVVKLVGKKHPEAAMIIMGWIVSIPVFCDSGFVILNPIWCSAPASPPWPAPWRFRWACTFPTASSRLPPAPSRRRTRCLAWVAWARTSTSCWSWPSARCAPSCR